MLNKTIYTTFVILILLISSEFIAIGGMPPPPPEPEGSNCCIADNGRKCEVWKDGDYSCECDYMVKEGDNEYICLDETSNTNAEYIMNGRTGCDNNHCQQIVCAIDSECCEEEIHEYKTQSEYINGNGGWDEGCAILAQENCNICGGTEPLGKYAKTDGDPFQLYSFFDLRDRESFVQVTNTSGSAAVVHVQVFDVSNSCNENNFFDVYTGNDTHVYNMRDIQTNDLNPSGIDLPDDAYGMVIVTHVDGIGGPTDTNSVLFGNFRIIDNAGYEYRTNSMGIQDIEPLGISEFYFNYNVRGNVTLSDVVGLTIEQNPSDGEVTVNPQETWIAFDIDIYNETENPFSCRDIIFACIDEDDPLLESVLEDIGVASVANFEYGINNAIPHSKGSELLCPGNNIPDGIVVLRVEDSDLDVFIGYVGLNSGNGRGSMDSFWHENFFTSNQQMLLF